ncbi:MAG: tetratricopeptide repeat protein, partial [Cyanobacteria bacterium P01_E01_bin.34]
LRAKRLLSLPPSQVWPQSTFVDTLLNTTDLETQYSDTILNLAAHQYKDLEKSLTCTEELSKLNLAYLLLSNGFKVAAPPTSASQPASATVPKVASTPTSSSTSSFTRSPQTTQLSVNPTRPTYTPKPVRSSPSAPTPSPQAPTAPSRSAAQPAPEPVVQASQKRFEQAKNMMARKQYKKAIQFLNIAIAEEPDNAEYYYERGLAHQKTNNSPRARQDFQRALKLDPKHDNAASKLNETGKKTVASGASSRPSTQQSSSSRAQSKSEQAKKGVFGRLFSR